MFDTCLVHDVLVCTVSQLNTHIHTHTHAGLKSLRDCSFSKQEIVLNNGDKGWMLLPLIAFQIIRIINIYYVGCISTYNSKFIFMRMAERVKNYYFVVP